MLSQLPASKHGRTLALAIMCAVLAACGGGGSSGTPSNSTDNASPGGVGITTPSYIGSGLGLIVETDDGSMINIWPGEKIARRVIMSKATANIRTELTLQSTSSAVQFSLSASGGTLTIDATHLMASTDTSVTITARNLDNGSTVQFPVAIKVLSPTVVATGRLTTSASAVTSPGGAIGIQVNANQLSASVGVTIRTAPLPLNRTRIRFDFDRDISTETGTVTLISNQSATTQDSKSRAAAMTIPSGTASRLSSNTPYPVASSIQAFPGYFLSNGNYRLASVSNKLNSLSGWGCDAQTTSKLCLDFDPSAAKLSSTLSVDQLIAAKENAERNGQTLVPVLFIHGYKNEFGSNIGGGVDTWNDFPRLVEELSASNKVFISFEFQWRTNASFAVVADELANALIRIYSLTGRPTRVIAHSFGGILVRTLLQGLAATQSEFDTAYVQSVLTLGTPHSGIFDKPTTEGSYNFPAGQDALLFEGCEQVSCYQAGEPVSWDDDNEQVAALVDAGRQGGVVVALANSKLPDGLPFVVGIGLKREGDSNSKYDEGDGLISFAGQRLRPSALAEAALYDCSTDYPRRTREVVLGAERDGAPDPLARPGVEATSRGYSHMGPSFVLAGLKATPDWLFGRDLEYGEPYAVGSTATDSDHASFKLFKATVALPSQYCDDRTVLPMPGRATLIGSLVTYTEYYPNLSTSYSIPNVQTIGEGIEFPSASIQLINDPSRWIDNRNDIGGDYIETLYLRSAQASSGAFNGHVYEFDPTSPRIINATLDPISSFTPAQAAVSFDAHRVFLNMAGVYIPKGARVLIRLQLALPGDP